MKLEELQKLTRFLPAEGTPDAQKLMEARVRELGLDPGSFYQELEMSSPFVDTHRDISWSNTHVQLHSHSFYELIWCVSCEDVEYLVGTERYRLRPGDLIFVPPGISHRPLLPEVPAGPYKRYVLWLSPAFMAQYGQIRDCPPCGNQLRPNMLRTGGTRWESLGELFRQGVREAERQQEGWEAAVIGNTLTLLTQLHRATVHREAQAPPAEQPQLLDRLTAFVEQRFRGPITLEQLAETFFVSKSTVSHLFQQKLGVSLYRHVTQRRLIEAKKLIGEGTALEAVARRCGFGDYSCFYRAFRKEYGISPRQFRSLQPGPREPQL